MGLPAGARLYFVGDERAVDRALAPALAGGIDLFQLRMKDAEDDDVLRVAERARAACATHGVPFLVNDRPDLAARCGADGVHVGQHDAEARAALAPLAPGERPRWVTISAVVALVLAAANAVALALGSIDVSPGVQAAWIAILLVCGIGMLLVKYWAVLGFQSVLLLQILVLSVLLLRVERITTALLLFAFLGLFGVLFYKLIRAMARIQMPAR